jgi:hypothetical protein
VVGGGWQLRGEEGFEDGEALSIGLALLPLAGDVVLQELADLFIAVELEQDFEARAAEVFVFAGDDLRQEQLEGVGGRIIGQLLRCGDAGRLVAVTQLLHDRRPGRAEIGDGLLLSPTDICRDTGSRNER